ncbi:MAG: DDE-type integrase/transposase/recombinase [Myxococcota bacterium]
MKRRRKRRSDPYPDRLGGYDRPNAVWCADVKGHSPANGQRCHPLTITDGFSRYLLCCRSLKRPLTELVQATFEAVFRGFGCQMRFAPTTIHRFQRSRLAGCRGSPRGGFAGTHHARSP